MTESLSPVQIRMAMAALNWSDGDLAAAAGVTPDAVFKIKKGTVTPQKKNRDALLRAFVERGVEFTPHDGVRLKAPDVEIFEGPERFDDFYDFVYNHMSQYGGEICVNAMDVNLMSKYRKKVDVHRQRMQQLVDDGFVTVRVLSTRAIAVTAYEQCRQTTEQFLSPVSFYVFGHCIALISFVHARPPFVVVVQSSALADAYHQSFDLLWRQSRPFSSFSGG